MTALATSTNAAAKLIVGVLSVASAVAAALNEKGPFTEQEELHQERAAEFNTIHRKLVSLHRQWARGKIDDDAADKQLTKLERSYDKLENEPPGVRDYHSARAWVEERERGDELLS